MPGWSLSVEELKNLGKPLIIGHRGYKHLYPENTLLSFEKAYDTGAPAIELDVMLSRDRKVVIIHDELLERTTNGKGMVMDYTLSELKNLDAGSWFNKKFKDCKIPALEEVFSLLGNKILINVEIKPECFEENPVSKSIEEMVLNLIETFNLKERIIISSFNSSIVKRIRKLDRSVKTAYIFDSVPDDLDGIIEKGIFSVHVSKDIAGKLFIEKMHEKGLRVFVWTVNDEDDFIKLVKNGVDGIFTDNPGYFQDKEWN